MSGDGRSTLIVTRQRIKKPQSDEEFRAEFEQLTPEEQDRRIELIENLDAVEFEHRLRILGRQTPEIEKLLKRRELPLYDRIALTGSELFYEEMSDPAQGCLVEVELLNPAPLPSPRPRMADISGWAKDLLEAQATQIGQQKAALEWQDAQLKAITDVLDRLTVSQQERE